MVETAELHAWLEALGDRIQALRKALDVDALNKRIDELSARMEAPEFWNDPQAAQGVLEELKRLKNRAEPVQAAAEDQANLAELANLVEAEDDAEAMDEVDRDAQALAGQVDRLETAALLSGPNDDKDVFFSVHAGAGGNDACECAEILLRMFLRHFERRGWRAQELNTVPGEEAGIRSATYRVSGENVYGYLRSEMGVHRIVRISPFSGKRETSFVGVDVMPEYGDVSVDIDENDLRVDTYRSSGKGGQHVNKTDSAVRITHVPTGVVVAVQNERSQHKNRAIALRLLKAKLQRMEEAKREKELGALYSEKGEIAFGSQIRNYVFQPYTQVKDTRTGHENGNIQAVMDGDLDEFEEAFLRWDVQRRRKRA